MRKCQVYLPYINGPKQAQCGQPATHKTMTLGHYVCANHAANWGKLVKKDE